MTSALVCSSRLLTAPSLFMDLQMAGIRVCATQDDVTKLVRDVALHAPDVLICDVQNPNNSWFTTMDLLLKAMPCPVLVFTNDLQAENAVKSVEVGIHVFVANGYSGQRLRSLIQLAQARFEQSQRQSKAFDDLSTRLEERKAVDRAKGILMRDQRMSDDLAFGLLRSVAMRTNQRLGQISQHVIQSAKDAEALNRAGQLRMLSQRLVKLFVLKSVLFDKQNVLTLLEESIQRVDDNLHYLRSHLSGLTFGDFFEPIERSWSSLKSAIEQGDSSGLNVHAEALLEGADRLTSSLEVSGNAPPLHLLNLLGRQRMLSQRFVKFVLQNQEVEEMAKARNEFELALTHLNGLPLSSPEIQNTLSEAGVVWLKLVNASKSLMKGADQNQDQMQLVFQELALGSELLLQLFEQLADHYSHSLDLLVG